MSLSNQPVAKQEDRPMPKLEGTLEKRPESVVSGTPELVADAGLTLGEGPLWDPRLSALVCVDINGRQVVRVSEANRHERFELPSMPGCIGLAGKDAYVIACEEGVGIWKPGEQLQLIVNPEPGRPENRFNDGKCDAAGRLWVGTMDRKCQNPTGALYVVERTGAARTALRDLTISNGIGWSPDGATMYHIDTPTGRVMAFDFDTRAGTIANPRTVVTIEPGCGYPDGMAVDGAGCLWIAMWDGHAVRRYDPRDGQLTDVVTLPCPNVTSCAFGGRDGKDLYITTAREGISEDRLSAYPQAGGIFKVRTNVSGVPVGTFGVGS